MKVRIETGNASLMLSPKSISHCRISDSDLLITSVTGGKLIAQNRDLKDQLMNHGFLLVSDMIINPEWIESYVKGDMDEPGTIVLLDGIQIKVQPTYTEHTVAA